MCVSVHVCGGAYACMWEYACIWAFCFLPTAGCGVGAVRDEGELGNDAISAFRPSDEEKKRICQKINIMKKNSINALYKTKM